MENKRYNEIDHKDIKTIDDINKIVAHEVQLHKKRKAAMKEGMATATAMSITSKIIIIIMTIIFIAIVGYVSFYVYIYFAGVYQSNVRNLENMKEMSQENESK